MLHSESPNDCPYGHGVLKEWSGEKRCFTCGWPDDTAVENWKDHIWRKKRLTKLKCLLGRHTWRGSRCAACGKWRGQDNNRNARQENKERKPRNLKCLLGMHRLSRDCKCVNCGKLLHELNAHYQCSKCHIVAEHSHQWQCNRRYSNEDESYEYFCIICGKVLTTKDNNLANWRYGLCASGRGLHEWVKVAETQVGYGHVIAVHFECHGCGLKATEQLDLSRQYG